MFEFPFFPYLNIELRHGEELCRADSCERGHGGRSCRVLSCGAAHEQLGLEQALQLLREVGEAHLLAGILQARVQALHRFKRGLLTKMPSPVFAATKFFRRSSKFIKTTASTDGFFALTRGNIYYDRFHSLFIKFLFAKTDSGFSRKFWRKVKYSFCPFFQIVASQSTEFVDYFALLCSHIRPIVSSF
jgi:hypothetical protein